MTTTTVFFKRLQTATGHLIRVWVRKEYGQFEAAALNQEFAGELLAFDSEYLLINCATNKPDRTMDVLIPVDGIASIHFH